MKIILALSVVLALTACGHQPTQPFNKLEVAPLDTACTDLPKITKEQNASELGFLDWVAAVTKDHEACKNRHQGLVNVLRKNQVIK